MKNDDGMELLRELAALPMTICVEGKPYKAALLSPADLAAAQQYVTAQRTKNYLAAATINEHQNATIHAEVIAKFHMSPISVEDLCSDPDGSLMVCHISLAKGGEYKGSIKELAVELDPQGRRDFIRTLFIASGVLVQPKAGDIKSDPLESTPDTKPQETDNVAKAGESG